jgi:CheY-like chemotaxis protein
MTRSKRILIVEDEAITALDLQKTLTDSGHAVVGIASTCEKALQLAEYHRPDIVLMDYNLKGGLNGATTARELDFNKVRIIFLTAHPVESVRECYGIVFDLLSKPVRRDELRQMLATTKPLPLQACA